MQRLFTKKEITTIFWNVWFNMQNGRYDNGELLRLRLKKLIDTYDPDAFGLNEVLVDRHTGLSRLKKFLEHRGYNCYFAEISPTDDKWLVGSLLATKDKPLKISKHPLGPDTQAARRGFKGCTVKALEADLQYGDFRVTLLLVYMSSLLPADWGTHILHRKKFDSLLKSINNNNLIIGGDFNETKYMLPWLMLPKHLKRRTGTWLNPTWRLQAKKRYLGFANYDNIIYCDEANLKLKEFRVLDRAPSDHAPLLAIFKII